MPGSLIHPELSYEVRGVLWHVYNSLGPMLSERYYQDAIAIGLKKRRIPCETEKAFEVHYEGERVGLYYVDVWIDAGKVLLELKVTPAIAPLHRAQAISYLKVSDADLAIVVNCGGPSLEDERLPNFLRDKRPEFTWQPQPPSGDLLYPELTDSIYKACHRVHFALGPGFLHRVYRRAVMLELGRSGIGYHYLRQLPVEYEGHLLGYQEARLIVVEDKVLLAAFALAESEASMAEQLKARMRRLGLKLGFLANFHDTRLAITPVRIK